MEFWIWYGGDTNVRTPKRLCCITGPDGAGKSTLLAALVDRLRDEAGIDARVVTVWDLMSRPDVRASFPIDPGRIDAYLCVLGAVSRTHFLLHCLAEATAQALASEAELLLLDGYWYKYLACEIALGAAEAEIAPLTATFPEPELVLYLDVPPSVAASRKQRFSRYESGLAAAPDAAAFAAFQAKVRAVLHRWSDSRGWTRLDGALESGALLDRAFREVHRRSRTRVEGS